VYFPPPGVCFIPFQLECASDTQQVLGQARRWSGLACLRRCRTL